MIRIPINAKNQSSGKNYIKISSSFLTTSLCPFTKHKQNHLHCNPSPSLPPTDRPPIEFNSNYALLQMSRCNTVPRQHCKGVTLSSSIERTKNERRGQKHDNRCADLSSAALQLEMLNCIKFQMHSFYYQ